MSHTLTLELSDQAFSVIQRQAEAVGIPPESLVETLLEEQSTQIFKALRSSTERQMARSRFEHHFGTLELEVATAIDNESIDADIAAESIDPHQVD